MMKNEILSLTCSMKMLFFLSTIATFPDLSEKDHFPLTFPDRIIPVQAVHSQETLKIEKGKNITKLQLQCLIYCESSNLGQLRLV